MADGIEIKMSDTGWARIRAMLARVDPESAQTFLWGLGAWAERHIQQTFRADGAISGFPKWERLSESTTTSRAGTPRLRYGTWKVPKNTRASLAVHKKQIFDDGKWWPGKVGPMPGYETQKRYVGGGVDRPLQAGGGFKRSFKRISASPESVYVGSQMVIVSRSGKVSTAEDIAGTRSVLRFNEGDWKQVRRLMIGWALGAKA